MRKLESVAIYCASSNQLKESYYREARRLGNCLAEAGIRTIYGDGGIGLMGALADGVLEKKGEIIGVIPQFMVDEHWNNPQSSYTIVTGTMHERKAMMERMADGMVAMPGGIGTMEELFECLTWKQLGLHTKPVVLLNTDGYFDAILALLDRMVADHFLRDIHRQMYVVVDSADKVIDALRNAPQWDSSIRREAAI